MGLRNEWRDLSHSLDERLSYPSYFPPPSFEQVSELSETTPEVRRFCLCTHMGTHLDAPSHFIAGGATLDDVGPERLVGAGVVWRINRAAGERITAADLTAARPALRQGDAVLLWTGYGHLYGTDRYDDHPFLDEAAAHWLVDQEARLVGLDVMTPDQPVSQRPDGFTFPVHRILLGAGVLILENVAAAGPLTGQRVELMVGALPLAGADGAPVRLLARPLRGS